MHSSVEPPITNYSFCTQRCLVSTTLAFNPPSLNIRDVRSSCTTRGRGSYEPHHLSSVLELRTHWSSGFEPTTYSKYHLVENQRWWDIAQFTTLFPSGFEGRVFNLISYHSFQTYNTFVGYRQMGAPAVTPIQRFRKFPILAPCS